jgi:hypothetical protein
MEPGSVTRVILAIQEMEIRKVMWDSRLARVKKVSETPLNKKAGHGGMQRLAVQTSLVKTVRPYLKNNKTEKEQGAWLEALSPPKIIIS